jgi:hypothetical protein
VLGPITGDPVSIDDLGQAGFTFGSQVQINTVALAL